MPTNQQAANTASHINRTRVIGSQKKPPQYHSEIAQKTKPARMLDNPSQVGVSQNSASTAQQTATASRQSNGLNGLLDDFSSVVTKPIQDKVEKQLDAISAQVREKLREQNGKNATDLEVAEYMLGMPTANMAKPLSDIGVTLRNCLIGMTVAICTTIYISRNKANERTNNPN